MFAVVVVNVVLVRVVIAAVVEVRDVPDKVPYVAKVMFPV